MSTHRLPYNVNVRYNAPHGVLSLRIGITDVIDEELYRGSTIKLFTDPYSRPRLYVDGNRSMNLESLAALTLSAPEIINYTWQTLDGHRYGTYDHPTITSVMRVGNQQLRFAQRPIDSNDPRRPLISVTNRDINNFIRAQDDGMTAGYMNDVCRELNESLRETRPEEVASEMRDAQYVIGGGVIREGQVVYQATGDRTLAPQRITLPLAARR